MQKASAGAFDRVLSIDDENDVVINYWCGESPCAEGRKQLQWNLHDSLGPQVMVADQRLTGRHPASQPVQLWKVRIGDFCKTLSLTHFFSACRFDENSVLGMKRRLPKINRQVGHFGLGLGLQPCRLRGRHSPTTIPFRQRAFQFDWFSFDVAKSSCFVIKKPDIKFPFRRPCVICQSVPSKILCDLFS